MGGERLRRACVRSPVCCLDHGPSLFRGCIQVRLARSLPNRIRTARSSSLSAGMFNPGAMSSTEYGLTSMAASPATSGIEGVRNRRRNTAAMASTIGRPNPSSSDPCVYSSKMDQRTNNSWRLWILPLTDCSPGINGKIPLTPRFQGQGGRVGYAIVIESTGASSVHSQALLGREVANEVPGLSLGVTGCETRLGPHTHCASSPRGCPAGGIPKPA